VTQVPVALQVWLGGRVVADLTISRRQIPQLRYRQDFIEQRGVGALGLSIPLPVSGRAYRGALVDNWIECLLPEGETRTVLERFFQVRRGDGFALLTALGRDCAGAVIVSPAGETLASDAEGPRPLTDAEVAEAVAALRQHPLGVDADVRVSRAAALAALPAAEVRLDEFGGRTVLVVTRFDRETKDGTLVRVHQEDGCQALGVDPSGSAKYQAVDGIASYRHLAGILTGYAADRTAELRRLGAMMTFTVAIGNTDAHLRNHAFLHGENTVSLAPVYDAAPTAGFAGTRQLALWVSGQPLLSVVTRDHLIREMASWGLDSDAACDVIDTTLTRLAAAYPEAAETIPGVPPAMVEACQTRTRNLLPRSK